MSSIKKILAAIAIIGAATVSSAAAATIDQPIGVNRASTAYVADGLQNAAWICGPYRCWWRPNYYNYYRAPGWSFYWSW